MKAVYRGFEIEAERATCLGGWSQVYLTAYRVSDGYELICEHTEARDPVRYLFNAIKKRIDEAYETNGESECVEPGKWAKG